MIRCVSTKRSDTEDLTLKELCTTDYHKMVPEKQFLGLYITYTEEIILGRDEFLKSDENFRKYRKEQAPSYCSRERNEGAVSTRKRDK